MTNYIYSKMNLIDYPQKYQMTPFEGKKFLTDYLKFRQEMINKIKPIKLLSLEQLIKSMKQTELINTNSNISTEYELLIGLSDIINNNYSISNNKIIEKLLKKFEITKKLYDEYSKDFSSMPNRNWRKNPRKTTRATLPGGRKLPGGKKLPGGRKPSLGGRNPTDTTPCGRD